MTNKPVHHFILMNGDHILAAVAKKTKTTITLQDAFIIDEHKDYDTGQTSLLLNQYLYGQQNAIISKSHIMVSTPVDEIVEKYYRTFVRFNAEHVQKSKYNGMKEVTEILEESMTQKSHEPQLTILKELVDIKQLWVPTSNTIN